jgi:3-deoxy-D-manno-octulosonic-acid transferase
VHGDIDETSKWIPAFAGMTSPRGSPHGFHTEREWMPWIVGWVLNAVYSLLLLAVAPLLLYRRLRFGKYRGGWREKLTGRLVRQHPSRRCVWFHAVSVGEVLQLQKVLDETAVRFPDAELLITTTTDTGYDVARTKYPQHTIAYFPLDFTWAVATALRSIRPDLVVLVELELWPNFIFEVERQRIPLALINGRIGEKSFRGYSRVKPLIRGVLGAFDMLAVQNDTYGTRLRKLGAPAERIVVTGNIKFDRVESDRQNPKTAELRHSFSIQPDEQVFIAGSTQSPEEAFALDTWQSLRTEFPRLRLVLVPRHKERFEEVAALVHQRGLPLRRRSQSRDAAEDSSEGFASDSSFPRRRLYSSFPRRRESSGRGDVEFENLPHLQQKSTTKVSTSSEPNSAPVLLLDTLGELAACWGLADFAFVGGSLTNRGGQNMLEPAGYGAAVLFGPNTWNFKDITAALLSRDAARVVRNQDELTQLLRELLQQPATAMRMGAAAREFVAEQQGATRRTVDRLAALFPDIARQPDTRAA